jgi:hypothetical protein
MVLQVTRSGNVETGIVLVIVLGVFGTVVYQNWTPAVTPDASQYADVIRQLKNSGSDDLAVFKNGTIRRITGQSYTLWGRLRMYRCGDSANVSLTDPEEVGNVARVVKISDDDFKTVREEYILQCSLKRL